VDLPITLDVVDASDAASRSQDSSAARYHDSAATEDVVSCQRIDQRHIAGSCFILKTETEYSDSEAAARRIS
jgi:hypothetical protein